MTTNNKEKKTWSINDSDRLYQVSQWGEGYFEINDKGNLSVNPERKENGPRIDVAEVIEEMKSQGISFPAVIRFHDILWSQVVSINETFKSVIEDEGYKGKYLGVYPIKVNQMREVVEEIVAAGSPYNFGLEAGSKPELMAVLAYNENPGALTVLNGYKDDEYMRLAMLGRKLGRKVIVVVEKLSELDRLLKISKEFDVAPMIGLRCKMSYKSTGKWSDSSGDRAKFGLSVTEILLAVERLKSEDLLDSLKLFHYHIGSQITDIKCVKETIAEAARIYAKLVKLGVDMHYIDVGGGLAIDYDGSKSTGQSSMNYTMSQYIADIVYGIKQVCDAEEVKHPDIVSESGRAITAQHSCVVTNVVDIIDSKKNEWDVTPSAGEHQLVKNVREFLGTLDHDNYKEVYDDARQVRDDALQAFKLGILSLEDRAKVETLFWKASQRVLDFSRNEEFVSESVGELEDTLAAQYLCNFSIFQSAADHWAIGQLLPVLPLTKLHQAPTRQCTIADITCDSDGKISKFIGNDEVRRTIPLHEIKPGDEYVIGMFLTGAYQDVMGDMHNLFGRLNEVHVFSDDDDPTDFYIEEVIRGASIANVLSTMQYTPEYMAHMVKRSIGKLIKNGEMNAREGVRLTDFYEDSLKSYTYLDYN